MDIRSAQKIAWDAGPAKVPNRKDISLGFGALSGELAKAFDTWSKSRHEITEELAGITILLFRLAEMVGTDLQEAVEAKLTVQSSVYEQSPNRVPVENTAAEVTAYINNGKLVRDKIPQIIRSKGQEPVIYIADAEEYFIRLRAKLREEVEEYLASDNDREELADILEVLYALARQTGTDQQQLERLRAAKAEKRGGFAERIIWFCNRQSAAQDIRIAAVKL